MATGVRDIVPGGEELVLPSTRHFCPGGYLQHAASERYEDALDARGPF